jgi:hypothetical protein
VMLQEYQFVEQMIWPMREREMSRKLELLRLVNETRRAQLSPRQRVLLRVSEILIALGHHLRERYAPLTPGTSAESPLECAPSN